MIKIERQHLLTSSGISRISPSPLSLILELNVVSFLWVLFNYDFCERIMFSLSTFIVALCIVGLTVVIIFNLSILDLLCHR